MGNRLSKIYTKTGDAGTTAVSDGIRISKSHPRILVLGALDKLNAQIGLLLCHPLPQSIMQQLEQLQHTLFDVGGEISMPELTSVTQQEVQLLEAGIDFMNETLPPLKEFILPGGSHANALCHVLRAECRTAETLLIALSEYEPEKPIRADVMAFINRLSDWFFVAARFISYAQKTPEVLWKNPFARQKPEKI